MIVLIGIATLVPCDCKLEDAGKTNELNIEVILSVGVAGRQPNCDMVLFKDKHCGSDIDMRVWVKDGDVNVNFGKSVV